MNQEFKQNFYETLTNIALCSHSDIKSVLIISDNIDSIEIEVKKHTDIKIIDKTDPKDALSFIQNADQNSYDIVICNTLEIGDYTLYIAHLNRILKDRGTLLLEAMDIDFNFNEYEKVLKECNIFRFALPFNVKNLNEKECKNSYVFASKQFHPTADLIVQKIDMLIDLKEYNDDLHRACFAIGVKNFKKLLGAMKI